MNSKTQSVSNLLVVCHGESDFISLQQILSNYFPNQNSKSTLLISNKYYQVHVNMLLKTWSDLFDSHFLNSEGWEDKNLTNHSQIHEDIQQNQNKTEFKETNIIKYDLMIMLVNQNQQHGISFQSLDNIIEFFDPEQFVLLINTPTPQQPWAYEQIILQKCNNFIQIVKEDLTIFNKTKPNWARGALLTNQQESNQSGIFSILDRMETTRWTAMIKSQKQTLDKKSDTVVITTKIKQDQDFQDQRNLDKKSSFKYQGLEKNHFQGDQEIKTQTNESWAKNSSNDQEMEDKRLEQQTREFQNMMGQMMSFKAQSAGMKDQQRKQKAQQLFASMFKGIMNFQ